MTPFEIKHRITIESKQFPMSKNEEYIDSHRNLFMHPCKRNIFSIPKFEVTHIFMN